MHDQPRHGIRTWVQWPSIWILRALTWPYFRVAVRGRANLPPRPFVGVINHSSNLDLPVMAWAVPSHSHFVGKAELFKVPLLGWWLRSIGGIPLRRDVGDGNALDMALQTLQSGGNVFLAPEGTRRHAGDGSARPRTGFVRLAQLAGCPVVPVGVAGCSKAMPPDAWLPRPVKLRIAIGSPMHLKPTEVSEANREALRAQAQLVMDQVYRLKNQLNER